MQTVHIVRHKVLVDGLRVQQVGLKLEKLLPGAS